MTNSWMMARHWVSVHSHRPQPQWGWPSGQMTSSRPCASSCSPAHPGCPK
uniref:Uncharacterized protein n=1 Tax=Cebus imitator TaxID=2715852 RepID=A0A2K5PX25_CEBIM